MGTKDNPMNLISSDSEDDDSKYLSSIKTKHRSWSNAIINHGPITPNNTFRVPYDIINHSYEAKIKRVWTSASNYLDEIKQIDKQHKFQQKKREIYSRINRKLYELKTDEIPNDDFSPVSPLVWDSDLETYVEMKDDTEDASENELMSDKISKVKKNQLKV